MSFRLVGTWPCAIVLKQNITVAVAHECGVPRNQPCPTLIVLDPNLADFARSNHAHKSRKAFMCRQAKSHVLTLQPIIDIFLIRNMEDSWGHKNPPRLWLRQAARVGSQAGPLTG